MKKPTERPVSDEKVGEVSQSQRFIEAARELGADDDEATFKAKLAVIGKHKPKDKPEPPKDKT